MQSGLYYSVAFCHIHNAIQWSQWLRLQRARGHVSPTFTNGWARGALWVKGHKTRNWPKSLTKSTNCTCRAKKVERYDKKIPPPHFQIRSGATGWAGTCFSRPLSHYNCHAVNANNSQHVLSWIIYICNETILFVCPNCRNYVTPWKQWRKSVVTRILEFSVRVCHAITS